MHFTFGQELRQEQKQIMTQRMIQSMEILHLSAQQLDERIDEELEKNPVLELEAERPDAGEGSAILDSSVGTDSSISRAEKSSEGSGIIDPAASQGEDDESFDSGILVSGEHEPEFDLSQQRNGETEFEIASDFEQDYGEVIDSDTARSQNWIEDQQTRRDETFANTALSDETLQGHLAEQLGWFDLSPALREMVERIINNLDVNGYFTYSIEDFLGDDRTAEEEELAAEALKVVKKLDPTGVGAGDLKECLLLQIDKDTPGAHLLRKLVRNHLEDIYHNRLPRIATETGCTLEQIQEVIKKLKRLNPRPCSGFTTETEIHKVAATLIPDVIVEKNEDGKWVVRIEDGRSRGLYINPEYEKWKKPKASNKETSQFITKNLYAARWFMDAINQRRMTLLKVSQAIVDYQTDFFERGLQALRPLTMQQIAELTGVHITTVSRACNDKWMLTSQGVFPFSRFFRGKINSSDGGEGKARDIVQMKIREIIDGEDKAAPYSDDALVKLLANEGIEIARRTVVKYRELMNIPNSARRKMWSEV